MSDAPARADGNEGKGGDYSLVHEVTHTEGGCMFLLIASDSEVLA